MIGDLISIVGWVLVRDPETFDAKYSEEVKVVLDNLGYDKPWN